MIRWLVLAVAAAVALAGCEKREGSLAKDAGKKVGETVMDFGSGVGAAIDTKMTVPVELSKTLVEKGLSKTVAKSLLDMGPTSKGFAVYLVSTQKLSGCLLAKAINEQGQEIGRSTAEIEFEPDDGKYVTFAFPQEMDSALVTKYLIDYKEPKPATSDASEKADKSRNPEIPKSLNPKSPTPNP